MHFLARGLGAHETSRADLLTLMMFVPEYLEPLIPLGETDAEAGRDEIAAFLAE